MKHLITCIAATVAAFISIQLNAQPAKGAYRIDRMNNAVYFCDTPVWDADIRTFKDLGYGYAKDDRHVYLCGEILEYVDPSFFRVDKRYGSADWDNRYFPEDDYYEDDYHYNRKAHSRGYMVSNFDVFYNGMKIEGASTHSFEILQGGYAKDAFNVYWRGKEIPNASGHSFEVLQGGYAKDAFNVYWRGQEIPDASAHSFEVLNGGYAKDAFNTYYMGRRID